jgi:hypothetical protein
VSRGGGMGGGGMFRLSRQRSGVFHAPLPICSCKAPVVLRPPTASALGEREERLCVAHSRASDNPVSSVAMFTARPLDASSAAVATGAVAGAPSAAAAAAGVGAVARGAAAAQATPAFSARPGFYGGSRYSTLSVKNPPMPGAMLSPDQQLVGGGRGLCKSERSG